MKTELELRHLRVFAAVVETGTRTHAARALGLSQSTVSETLAALERAIGGTLFQGTARGQDLTPAGEVLLAYARKMAALTNDLASALAATSTEVKATLNVAAVESVSAYVLPSCLATLRKRWPAVRVALETRSCADVRDRVASGACDLGLTLETEDSSAVGEVLAKGRLLILSGSTHALARRIASPDDLRRSEFHMCDGAGNYHDALRHLFEAAGLPAPRTHAMGTIEGVKRAIMTGASALGLLPEHAVEPELADGALVEVRTRPALPELVLRAVLAPGAERSPVVSELLANLRPERGLRLGARQTRRHRAT